MRETCLKVVYELAKRDDRVVFIGSDLGSGTLKDFKRDFPSRFFMEGISEAAIIGMAAGLAMEGHIVYVNTIATFLTRRCYDQIAIDLCLHNVNVRLLATGAGLAYAPLGPTHEAIEDIAILRSLPGMTILAPADALEMRRLMLATLDHKGPMYVRQSKGFEPVVTANSEEPFKIGSAIPMRSGDDILLVDTGIGLQVALQASDILAQQGIEAGVLHLPTVKPLDTQTLIRLADKVQVVATIEEHTVIGGLGGAVAEVLAEACLDRPLRLKRFGVPDVFPDRYGDQTGLMKRYGIHAEHVAAELAALFRLGRKPSTSQGLRVAA